MSAPQTAKIWRSRSSVPVSEGRVREIAEGCGVTERLARLLMLRGFSSAPEAGKYLEARLACLEPPEKWQGMAKAADILTEAVLAGKKIAVWGDYDVDGVTATALALSVLRFHGADPEWHIPDRRSEGYGMNCAGVDELARRGVELLITVDCGISDHEAVSRAREKGMTVVVTDHHLPPVELPPANVICDPRIGEGACASLAGVGVIFYVMAAMNSRLAAKTGRKLDMREMLDLAALGTLADMVSLEGQNRILVKNGMKLLSEARRPGIAELKVASGFAAGAELCSEHVSFSLAPRINAAGRIASAAEALRLLLSKDHAEARSLAGELNICNMTRRSDEEAIFAKALQLAEGLRDAPAFVLAGDDWNQGVIGIVASRMVERYNKPAILLSRDGDSYKGSGRSVEGIDLHAAIASCSGDLLAFGGHTMAAGLKLLPEKLDLFRAHFCEAVKSQAGPEPAAPVLLIDDDLDFRGASDFIFLKELEMLQPYGNGNPEPVFRSPVLRIDRIRTFGKQHSHAMLDVTDPESGIRLTAKAWRRADSFPQSLAGQKIRLAYSPSIDMFNGVAHVDLRILDWRMEG